LDIKGDLAKNTDIYAHKRKRSSAI
jgi:hypothetical protein